MLTALYRSHYWVQRTLGNLFGLTHLQYFIAQEAGLKMGPLICHSTMAQLETHAKRWNGRQVRDLVARCRVERDLRAAA
jgi:thymidylate synthase